MNAYLSLLILFTLCLSPAAGASHGTLSFVKNEAWLIKKGAGQDEQEKVRRGTKIEVGDKLKTGKDSYAKILMVDKNLLHVGPETEFILEAYRAEGSQEGDSIINVVYGRVRAALENKYDEKKSRFRINTEAAILGVRGTDFLAQHNAANATTKALVFEHKIRANGINSSGDSLGDVTVSEGEMTTVAKGQPPTPPVKIPSNLLEQYNTASLGSGLMVIAAAAAGTVIPPIPPIGISDGKDKNEAESPKQEAPLGGKGKTEKEEEKKEPKKKPEEPQAQSTKPQPKDNDDGPGIGFAFKAGTLGASAEVSYPITNNFRVKVDAYNTFRFSFSGGAEDFYENTVDFTGVGLLAEWGSAGPWQLIFGAYFSKNKMEVEGTPLGNETIGATSYNFAAGDQVVGDGEFDSSIAPYVGVGWKTGAFFGLFKFVGDIGVMHIGELKVNNLDYTGPAGVSAADEALEIVEIEEEAKKFQFYPVIRLGLAFEF